MRIPLAFAAVLALGGPAPAADGCACKPGQCVRMEVGTAEASGTLIVKRGAYMLKLDRPTCFKGTGDPDDFEAGADRPGLSLVQLAPDEEDVPRLKALVGKRVRLKGDAFGAHTRHHITDALIAPKEIAEAR